jgi:hypothetical protein
MKLTIYIALIVLVPGFLSATKIHSKTQPSIVPTINILKLGADNTGKVDCSDLIAKAQEQGNVYFPKGTYLVKAIDLISNRKYFGDGMGLTILKANHKALNFMFGIATFDYDKRNHPNRNIENLEISDLTIDFNFDKKWYTNFCPIAFKGKPGNYIRNVNINKIEFIDNAKRLHPELIGEKADDAWCISLSSYADSTTDIVITDCLSKAESHQFVAGGGKVLKRVSVTNNYVLKPRANGITFTTISQSDAIFEDFVISGNTIIDPSSSAILFGHDPTNVKRAVARQIFSGLVIKNNKITLGDYKIYGQSFPKKKILPFIINLSAPEPSLKNVVVQDNIIEVAPSYPGNNILFGRIHAFNFNRPNDTVMQAFKQPGVNQDVVVKMASNMHKDKPAFQKDGYITIDLSGLYKIMEVDGLNIKLRLMEQGNSAPQGTTIQKGSVVRFTGGGLENIQFVNNIVKGSKQLLISPQGVVNNLVVKGNNKVAIAMTSNYSFVSEANFLGNTDFYFKKSSGSIKGNMQGNKLLKSVNNAVDITNGISKGSGLINKSDLKIENNN